MQSKQLPGPVRSGGIAPTEAQRPGGGDGEREGTLCLPGGTGSSATSTARPALWARMASWYCYSGHGVRARLGKVPRGCPLPTGPPRTLTMRSCMRAFRWSPLVLAWAAATWYRSIRCSSASRRVRGGGGTSGPDGGKGEQGAGVRFSGISHKFPSLPTAQGARGLPGVEGTVLGAGGCGDGEGGSGGSWSEGREVRSSEGLAWGPPHTHPRLVCPEGGPQATSEGGGITSRRLGWAG